MHNNVMCRNEKVGDDMMRNAKAIPHRNNIRYRARHGSINMKPFTTRYILTWTGSMGDQ